MNWNWNVLLPYTVLIFSGFWLVVVMVGNVYSISQFLIGRRRAAGYEDPYLSFPVSILKPLKGLEDNLEENLEAFFHLDYPVYELLFSVSDPNDPACPLVQELMERYPEVEARLVIGGASVGPNPKVNNLVYSYQLAQHDYLLICDSTIRPDAYFLRRMASYCDPGVGLVTSGVAGFDGSGLGGWLEALYLNTFCLRWTFIGRLLRTPVIAGKAMLFRRSTAERFGGLQSLSPFLAEDFMLAKSIQKLGLSVAIMHEPVFQEIGDKSFAEYWSRHLRWGRIRKTLAPLAFFLEGLTCPAVLSGFLLLTPWADASTRATATASFCVLWASFDLLLWWTLGFEFSVGVFLAWGLREILAPVLWLHALCGSTVTWRGARLRLGPHTRLLAPEKATRHLRLAPNS